ncbi:chaperonin 10-like protein [Mycena alexandri]|uniref:Chaperonin 10-like protein n=1 Tax=Mycena alexandri TaxID=1745969 RepID=A0AAD6S5Q7_9AGAR|nr:chaperonin 10-like protein [Mycena alexandri]
MKALVTRGNGTFELQDVKIPSFNSDQILVKVVAAAQNPTDWKTLLLNKKPGLVLGCDFSGIVDEIGSDVPAGLRKLGERVAGFVHGGITSNGAFAEYVVIEALVIVIPDSLTFERAAQLGAASMTVCQALYQCLGLPMPIQPTQQPADILIWSGTSATGQYAVQFAKLAGLPDEVFDYADSRTPKKIVRATGGTLKYAMDCISEGMTPNQVSMSLGNEGGTIATLLPYQSRREDARTAFILVYSIFGQAVEFPFEFPANLEHRDNAKMYCKVVSEVLSTLPVKTVPVRLYPHGLSSVHEGFEDMKAGKVHAEKITYRIADTPGLVSC